MVSGHKNELYTNPPSSSRNFLRQQYLPKKIVSRHQVIRGESPYEYHESVKLLFIRSGFGVLLVNGTEFVLEPGSCFLLYVFHFHKIVPTPGDTIDAYYCLIPYTTFQFLLLSPGSIFRKIEFSATPPHCVFDLLQQNNLAALFLEKVSGADLIDPFIQNVYLFEAIAHLNRLYVAQDDVDTVALHERPRTK